MWDRTPGRYDLTATSRAGLRIELADIAGEIGGESDVAVLVGNETIGTGVPEYSSDTLENCRLQIEPPERACHLSRVTKLSRLPPRADHEDASPSWAQSIPRMTRSPVLHASPQFVKTESFWR